MGLCPISQFSLGRRSAAEILREIQDLGCASGQTPALSQVRSSASTSSESSESFFEECRYIDGSVGGPRKNDAKLIAFIGKKSDGAGPRADFHGEHLQFLNATAFERGRRNAVSDRKPRCFVIQ